MNRNFLKIGLGVLAAAGLVWAAPAAVPGTVKQLHGHVPPVVSQLSSTGRVNATNKLHLAIGLPLRNQEGLNLLLEQVADPASPNFRHFLTPAQFADQFGAAESDYQAVAAFAKANHLTVTATHPNRLVLDVSGAAADIETAFQVELRTYQHPTEARTFFAPATEPTVSASLPILHVSGMDNYYLPHPRLVSRSQSRLQSQSGTGSEGGPSPSIGSGPGGAYLGTDFRTAYVPGTTLTGAGQNVGLLQFDGFYASDIAAYETLINLTNGPQVVVVPIDGGVPAPGGGNSEVCLDIEMNLAMAPGLGTIYVYEAPNPSPWVDLLSRMANDNLAKQLSCSWGGGPPDATAEQIFQQMAVQGQSFYNAVGDSDAFVDPANPVEFPSDSPHITQVGGTTLTTGAGAVYASEKVWNWGGGVGTCGGISTYYTIPTWQQGFGTPGNHGSATMRNMPDVALTADNVWVTSDNGLSGAFGGTSCAAPLWAAYTSLINQQNAINGNPPAGFVNPVLYSLAKTGNYTNYFNDTTVGDNTWQKSPTNFFAVPGYDLCTGLGTPNGMNLINALAGGVVATGPIISAPLPPWGTNLAVMNGSNPNGDWFLFVQDDKPLDVGMITNGWYVTLTTANPVGYAADNQLNVTSTSLPVAPGASITNLTVALDSFFSLTLAVTNYGPSSSASVSVTNALPAVGITLVSSNPPPGTSVQINRSVLTWTVGNLPINTGTALTLNFKANVNGTYTNAAQVLATTSDPNPDDDYVGTLITVVPPVPPQLTPHLVSGGTGGFQLSVTNSPGQSVIIQATTNLVPANWINLFTNTEPFTFINFDSTNYRVRFYRAVTGP